MCNILMDLNKDITLPCSCFGRFLYINTMPRISGFYLQFRPQNAESRRKLEKATEYPSNWETWVDASGEAMTVWRTLWASCSHFLFRLQSLISKIDNMNDLLV